jgi:dihydrofolate reductase
VAGDKDVGIGGGADVIQQYLAAGLADELRLHLESPYATHLFFTVRR